MKAESSPIQIAEKSDEPLCQVRLKVNIDPVFSQKEHKKAMGEIAKEISLPGFRKGKIPLPYLQKHYHNQIDSRWSQQLAESTIAIALKLTSPPPFSQNQRVEFSWDRLGLHEVSTLIARFESEPSVPDQIDDQALQIEPPKRRDASQKAVQSALLAESEKRATLREITGPSRVGLFIDFEITAQDDQEQILLARKNCQLNQTQLPKWAFDLLLDLEVGEKKLTNAAPDDGKPPIACCARIDRLCERTIPPLDNALAKEFGFESIDLWRTAVTQRLKEQSDDQFRSNCHQMLLDAFVKGHPFEVPKSALEREIESLREKDRGKRFKDEEEMRQRALISLRQFFLLSHWSQTRLDLVSKEQIDSIVFAQSRHLDPKSSKEILQRQLAFLYHNARLSTVASRVLDELMVRVGLTDKTPIPPSQAIDTSGIAPPT